MKRVVVTGIGAVTPVGIGRETTWAALVAGKSGIGRIQNWDASNLEVQIAGEVKGFDPKDFMDPKLAKRMDRFAQFAVACSREALEDAGLEVTDENRDRIGIAMNTGGGGIPVLEREMGNMINKGPKWVSPFTVPLFSPNMACAQVSMAFDIHGPIMTSVAACAAGILSYIDGTNMIQRGDVDVVIAGGAECGLTPTAIASLANMGALAKRNDDPEGASRPFDLGRDGFVFSEGGAVMILESEEHALARGARIYAISHGGASTADAFHITAPNPDGIFAGRAMTNALKKAGKAPDEVDFVAAHATATGIGDIAETKAIKLALGDHARKVAISANKSMLGHLLGAAGAVSAMGAVLAIRDGVVPPTINLTDPDPECDLDYVPNVARKVQVDVSLANGFGFGGQNGVAIFERYRG